MSALLACVISQASSPICPFRTFPDLKSFGNPETADTNLGLDFFANDSFEEFVIIERLVPQGPELEQLYSPATMERDSKRQ